MAVLRHLGLPGAAERKGSGAFRWQEPREGSSLLCLVSDASGKSCAAAAKGQAPEGGGWREWVDLEHNTCYNNTNHWSALTDGTSRP